VLVPPVNLSSIDDQQLQAALRPLVDAWNVRNGYAGNREDRFLTKSDILSLVKDDAELRREIISASKTIGDADSGGGGGEAGGLTAAHDLGLLSGYVFNDPLWVSLGTRIDSISFNINGIKTDLNTKESKIQGNQNAINGLGLSVSSFTSETDAILSVLSTQFSANVVDGQWEDDGSGNQVWKPSVINFGSILGQYTTWSNAVAAVSEKTDVVEARLNGCVDENGQVVDCDDPSAMGVTVEQNMAAVADLENGLSGEYTLKVDVNGFVAGFGLAVTDASDVSGVRSRMYIRADRFAIGHPDTGSSDLVSGGDSPDAVLPFIVQNGNVYIDQAIIARANIDWAQITNANIESASIKELSVDKLIGGTGKFYSINSAPNVGVTKRVPGVAAWDVGSGWVKVFSRTYVAEKYLKKNESGDVITDSGGSPVYVALERTIMATVVLSIDTKIDEGLYVQLRWVNEHTGGSQASFVQNEESSNSTRVQVFATKYFDVVPTYRDLRLEVWVSTHHGKTTSVLSVEGHVQTIYGGT
jgi:hypothetical protein